uniref:Uncharacterized protein n=1 Tax=Methylophaga nitratireducenticrescens TaxID=754476 RepID=I1XGV2_METNJ
MALTCFTTKTKQVRYAKRIQSIVSNFLKGVMLTHESVVLALTC